jgi:gamma-glutamylcyclotransferase (GGCT)/AIG2-like uncharacterized protein YtfP
MDDSDFDMTSDSGKRPLFLYGTLKSKHLLALILTGERENTAELTPHLARAVIRNFRRGQVQNRDYPALVRAGPESTVEGLIFYPRNPDDRRKIDNFEGEQYTQEIVKATIESGEEIEVSTYVWNGRRDAISPGDWDEKEFETMRLGDWLDLFEGMDFI